MTTKHTPGPWHWVSDALTGRMFNIYAPNEDRQHVCTVNNLPTEVLWARTPERAEANARLIAAAPELYSSLCAAVEYAPHGEACSEGECMCWQRYARAALAKAEGGAR